MESYDVLVLILGGALAILLMLAIAALVMFLQVLATIKRITTRAEKMMGSVEAVGEFFRAATGPVAVTKIVANIVESFTKKRRK